jgi:hypothetical protein
VTTVENTGRYGKGLGLTVGFVGRFLPRQLFPNKDEYIFFAGGFDFLQLRSETGLKIPFGSAPSGFATGFAELGFLCPIIWIIAGYFYRRFWDKAILLGSIRSQGLLAGYTMAMLYAITQDLLTGQVNLVYVLLPLSLVYYIARAPRVQDSVRQLS